MDNLTHTLIGAVAGEALARTLPVRAGILLPATRRNLLVAIGVMGSNLPDIDLAWAWRGAGGSDLAYVLGHRGYTHTLVGCAALAALLYAGVALWLRWRGLVAAAVEHRLFAALAVAAVFGHLGMDALNSYGLHPFWPWDNRWYYGDALFIVEPLYWIAAVPLLFILRSRLARACVGVASLAGLAATLVLHAAQPVQCTVIVMLAALLGFAGWRRRPQAALYALGAMVVVTGGFLSASHVAEGRLRRLSAVAFPGAETLDAVLTPTPTQPGCWDVLLLQLKGGTYAVRQGQLAVGVQDAAHCVGLPGLQAPAEYRPMPMPATASASLRWSGEFAMPVVRLAELAARDCTARELLQFARVPYAVEQQGQWRLGDLRFAGGGGFAEVRLPPRGDSPCRFDAPWLPPRADLLSRG